MTAAPTILLVDDDDDLRDALAAAISLAELDCISVPDGDKALAVLDSTPVDVIVSDIRMPGIDGRQLLQRVTDSDPDLPVILMTGHGDIEQAVAALRQGAYDFLAKPFATERLLETVERAVDRRRLLLENRQLRAAVAVHREQQQLPLLGTSQAVQRLVHAIAQIGGTGIDVLIEGEWGTGKQAVAQLLARTGEENRFPVQPFDCGSLPEAMLEAALFGHGAPQQRGAVRGGALAAASGKTLLLAGVETLSLAMQSRLLHRLAQRDIEVSGVTADAAMASDHMSAPARIISTTTANLPDRVAAGSFRADLYYRLAPVRLVVPPLRARRADIPVLFMRLLSSAAEQFQRPVPELSDALLARLANHDWPGNLRELKNYADQAILNLDRAEAGPEEGQMVALPDRVAAFEAEAIRAALRLEGGRIAPSCARLGLPRKTLYDKMTKYGIVAASFRP